MTTEYSYGLDIAGYSSGKSALARTSDGKEIEIIGQHAFHEKCQGADSLKQQHENEKQFLYFILKHDNLYIDAPIDLQELIDLNLIPAEYIWQLTLRPVDKLYKGLPPMGSYLAAVVQRVRFMLKDYQNKIGTFIFETYPAAILKKDFCREISYKGSTAIFENAEWKVIAGKEGLAYILNKLKWTADHKQKITDDEFDAALCALVGKSDSMVGIEQELHHEFKQKFVVPKGYKLIKNIPEGVKLSWLKSIE